MDKNIALLHLYLLLLTEWLFVYVNSSKTIFLFYSCLSENVVKPLCPVLITNMSKKY